MNAKLANAFSLTHPNGYATFVAAADITQGSPLKIVDGQVTPTAAAADVAMAVALDDATAGDIVPVAILGVYSGTVTLVAKGALAVGDPVAANATKATTGGMVIGRALTAASASGDPIVLAHCVAATL